MAPNNFKWFAVAEGLPCCVPQRLQPNCDANGCRYAQSPLCKKTENPLPLRRMVHVIGILSILYTLITVFRRHISQGLRYKETLERFGNNNFLPQLSRERLFPFLPFLENYCPFHISTHWKTTFIKRHKEEVKICQIPSLHHLSKM